jgi:hypothetical protein
MAIFEVVDNDKSIRYIALETARAYNLMELATYNNIKVTIILLYIEEGVANSTIRGCRLCNFIYWP